MPSPGKVAAVAVAACFGGTAWANPTGGVVVHGAANFSNPAVNVLNINTLTPKTIINWGSFSISAGELTRILQPTALSAVLNRVVGSDPSAILGALQSNGRVFLLNPNGIVFGAGSQINVAGLVASTLNLSDADFLSGRMNFTNGVGAGSVVNQGSINAAGGPVYLIGNSVTNNGLITSPNGEVVLAAGNSVELVNPGTPNLRVEITAPENEARNLGTITAEAGRIGIYAGLIRQSGVINADSAVAEGGRIILKSTKRTDLEAGSVTSARGTSGGEIIALSDMGSGTTTVSGRLDASASAGNGGFVETSAANVQVTSTASVNASGSIGGQAGTWLIDPNDFYIAYGGGISGPDLAAQLDTGLTGTNVSILTSSTPGGVPGSGDIHVDDTVVWTKGSTLTLTAERHILFGLTTGTELDAGTTGNVILNAAGNIQTNAGGGYIDIKANHLTANAVTGIGNVGNPLQLQVTSASLNNTTSNDIKARNFGNLSFSASNPNGAVIITGGFSDNLIVGTGDTVNAGSLSLDAGHIEIRGNTTASGNISLTAGLPSSIIVGSGANLHSTAGDVYIGTDNIDLSAAGVVKGNNIHLQNFSFLGFDVGFNTGTSNQTTTAASLAKLELNNPASGFVKLEGGSGFGGELNINEAVTFSPTKVQTLHLVGRDGVFQQATAPVVVKNLRAVSNFGPVMLDAAVNNVETLSGAAREQFRFRNSGNLNIVDSGISVTGIPGSTAQLNIEVTSGSLTVSAPVSVSGADAFSFSGAGGANLQLTASGAVIINDAVSANGGDGAEGNGGSAQITVNAGGGITVSSGATVSAQGGVGGSSFSGAGGHAGVLLHNTSTGAPITISGSVSASGGNGSSGGGIGTVTVQSAGGVNIASTALIQAGGGSSSFSFSAPGNVVITAYGGNIVQDGQIYASGGTGSGIRLSAVGPGGAIVQNNPSAMLHASSNSAYGSGAEVWLEAVAGIGTTAAPVRINHLDEPDIFLQNSGSAGDIAVSFYGGAINIDSISGVFNSNPAGGYFIQAEQGGINLNTPFTPDVPLSAGQFVELKALNGGSININSGSGGGIIIPGTGTGNVKLTASDGGSINLAAGTVVAGNQPELTADHMDIQGQVLSSSGFIKVMPATPGRDIELGTSGPVVGALALDNAELNNMTFWDGTNIPAPGGAGGGLLIGDNIGGSGALTFTGNVNSSAYLNVYGTSIAQSGGKIVGGVSGHAGTGNVTLTQPTNEISSVGGSTNGGTFTVTSTVTMYTGDITTNGGNINIQTTGPSLLLDSLMNAGTGTVQLASAGNIVDSHVGLDIQASSATLTAPGGIGTSLDPIETQLSTLSVSATGGTGEIGIINTGNLLLSSLSFSGVTAAVETSGVLTQGSSINVTGNLGLLGQGGLNLVSGINTSLTSNVSLEAGTGADVVFSSTSGVNTSGGAISVTAGRDIIYGGSSQVNSSSGNILFDAGNDVLFNTQRINTSSGTVQISAGRDYLHNSTDSHNTSTGSLTIGAGRDFTYGSTSKLNTLSGNIAVHSVGNATFTAGGANSSTGAILVQAGGAVSLSGGAQLVSSGNSVGVEALGAAGAGVTLTGASTKVEGTAVSIIGTADAAASSDNVGVRINGATVRSTSGDIEIIGTAGNGTSNNNGIRIDGSALISSAADILLDGTGASGTSDNTGVKIGGATVQSVGGGFISITGHGGSGSADNNDGVRLESGAMITTAGNILIEGFGGSGGNDTVGVKLVSGSTVQSTGGGIVQLYGEGGPGVDNNHGVRLEGSALVTSAGNIEVTGFADGSGNDNTGVKFAGGTVQGTGASNVTVYGEGSSAGVNSNEGIRIESGGSVLAASGALLLTGFGGGSGADNTGIKIAGTVSNTGPGAFTLMGVGAGGAPAAALEGGSAASSASTMTFAGGFDWNGGTIGGSGLLQTPAGAVTNVTASVALAPGKTWNNGGTVNIIGSGTIDLGDFTAAYFNNLSSGVVNIASGAGWSFISNPSTQVGEINNAGIINVNQNTSWEAAFNQAASGTLNIAAGKFVSMQNGRAITGAANIGAGGTLWVSERHGSDTLFNNMSIGGTGTLQVVGSGPVAQFMNISAPGITLRLGSGGQINVHNGTTIVGGLTLDSPAFGSAFSMTDATFAQATGNLTVPSNASYAGSNTYVAQAGDLLVSGVVNGGAGSITLASTAGNLKVNGGSVLADVVSLFGGNSVTVGDSAASVPSSVTAGSALTVASLGDFKIIGGSASGASALVSSSGALTVSATGDVALAGGSGANAWAKLSGNPDVMLAGIGGAVRLDAGSGTGSYAKIDAIAPTTIYLDLINASSGGYFVNGIEGVLYDPITGTGFFAGGLPAVLGTNLVVTYGGVPLPPGSSLLEVIEEALQAPTQTLIVATNESTTPPEAEKEKNVFNEDKKEKKKEAPVCK